MKLARWCRHAWYGLVGARHAFTPAVCAAIESAVAASERHATGEICFVVEAASSFAALRSGQTPRQRALSVFANLGVWDTEANTGTLIFVSLADRCVEIVADRGIAARVAEQQWQRICQSVEARFRVADYAGGSQLAIRSVAEQLALHFGGASAHGNELPNQPILL
jgi:uncharacterized membrane protein